MKFLDWPSDGIVARVALIFYGVTLLLFVIPKIRRNRVLARLLPLALAWHLVVWAFTSFWMVPHFAAETGADNYGYHLDGLAIAGLIRSGNWADIQWGWNTDAIKIITGFIYAPAGGDIYGMMFLSAVLGLCGSLYFCLAFAQWSNPIQSRKYALIILILPSFAMWTGLFGKDSWIALGMGLAAYGYSCMLKARRKGLPSFLAGVVITTVVRPHIAVTVAAATFVSYLWVLTKNRGASFIAKIQTVVLLGCMLVALAWAAQNFLKLDDVSVDSLDAYGETRGSGNAVGGSAVDIHAAPGIAGTLLAFPRGIVRELFEPFPWEVHSFSQGLAASENLFILWFILGHIRRLRKLFRGMVREPYLLFSSILALSLLLIFSLTPNLGLLSRERAQFIPFVFAPLVASEAFRKLSRSVAGVRSPGARATQPRRPHSADSQPLISSRSILSQAGTHIANGLANGLAPHL